MNIHIFIIDRILDNIYYNYTHFRKLFKIKGIELPRINLIS